MAERFDLVLKGGHVIDPAQAIDATLDVAVRDGRIAALQPSIPADAADRAIDVRDRLVLPGLIDTHAHVYTGVTGTFGLEPDLVGVESGTTALVDQGGPSVMTFAGFRRFIAEPAASRTYAFISAYVIGGLEGHYYADLYGPSGIDIDATVKAAAANADLVKGVKAHAEIGGFARWGAEAIRKASEIGRQASLPVYYHLGQLWPLPEAGGAKLDPDDVVPEVLELMRPGDILAHPFTRHPGGFVEKSGRVHPIVREAIDRGLKIDVGHGSHFSFAMARTVLEAGILPDTLGADMHGYNTKRRGTAGEQHLFSGQSRFSLAFAMTELLALGVPLATIVPMVTSNAARMLGLQDEIGSLRPGMVADVTVLADERGRWKLADNEGTTVTAERFLRPSFCLRAGQHFDANADILPEAMAA